MDPHLDLLQRKTELCCYSLQELYSTVCEQDRHGTMNLTDGIFLATFVVTLISEVMVCSGVDFLSAD